MTTATNQPVSEVMTPRVVSVSSDASVIHAAEAMRDNDIADVLVMDGDELRGVITDRDLAVRVLAAQVSPATTPVGQVCSTDVVTVAPDMEVSEAVRLMREQAVRRLPVVGDGGRAHGILTIGDLAVALDPISARRDQCVVAEHVMPGSETEEELACPHQSRFPRSHPHQTRFPRSRRQDRHPSHHSRHQYLPTLNLQDRHPNGRSPRPRRLSRAPLDQNQGLRQSRSRSRCDASPLI